MNETRRSAVVFAYHNVGVRSLAVLLAHNIDVRLIVTHEDNPNEIIWFRSVAELAALHGIPVIKPADPDQDETTARVRAVQPDFLFSFYYRHMLNTDLLTIPAHGAYNLHGSLLPKYRGRVPVNWAVLHGEAETGASLHRMVRKPDAGALVDQCAVPILPNDTAREVFEKVTCAAEIVLSRSLPKLIQNTAKEIPLDLPTGSYFSGRKPEDGRIDWQASAWQIHNLIRAVAPPYPGAFADIGGTRLRVLGSFYRAEARAQHPTPRLYWENKQCWLDCSDGRRLLLTQLAVKDAPLNDASFNDIFGSKTLLV